MSVFSIGMIGYATSLIGFIAAFLFSLYADKFSRRFQGVLGGFTGGVLIAFVCFGLLPQAFADDGLFYGTAGIIAGACAAMFIETVVTVRGVVSPQIRFTQANPGEVKKSGMVSPQRRFTHFSAVIALGVALHNIPEGIALGSVLGVNFNVGLSMCPVIAMHCFPEALAVVVPLRKNGAGFAKLLAFCFLLALPMGISSLVGASMSNVSHAFVSLCAAFAGGVIIYITCGEIIPGSKKTWNGRLTAFGAVFGFVVGVLMTLM